MEHTLMLIKPDAVMRGHIGDIVKRLESKGFTILAMKLLHLSQTQARELYAPHEGKDFYEPTVAFMTSAPIVALAVGGDNVIPAVRKMMGATNPLEAECSSIRGTYAQRTSRNCVHGSDSPESAARETAIFFSPDEILDYRTSASQWL